MYTLSYEEMIEINGGGIWKTIFVQTVGVCGAVVGALDGAVVGYTLAGNVFTGPIAVGAGVVGGVAGAAGGYYGGKEAAEVVWDIFR
jgi:hypothetical protein